MLPGRLPPSFLAADRSACFAPSTPGYMLQFQTDNAEIITVATEDLRLKIEAEKTAMAEEEVRKKEIAEGDNARTVLPTDATAK